MPTCEAAGCDRQATHNISAPEWGRFALVCGAHRIEAVIPYLTTPTLKGAEDADGNAADGAMGGPPPPGEQAADSDLPEVPGPRRGGQAEGAMPVLLDGADDAEERQDGNL